MFKRLKCTMYSLPRFFGNVRCTRITFLLVFTHIVLNGFGQKDSLRITSADPIVKTKSVDTPKKFSPRLATLRSVILPGWGQFYNKKYWKIPIIYAALGITGSVFAFNLKTYKLLRQAFIYRSDTIPSNDVFIDRQFINLSAESLRTYRNSYRQNIDYTVLVFLVLWGIQVVDATVDAHLKAFDVSDNISMKIKAGSSGIANTAGISFVFSLKDNKK